MRHKLHVAASLACLVLLTGCAVEPYARVDGNTLNAVDVNRADVRIVAIDEQWFGNSLTEENVEPGLRAVTFVSMLDRDLSRIRPRIRNARRSRGFLQDARTIQFEFEPCVHYFFNAYHPDERDPTEWTVELESSRLLAGCNMTPSDEQLVN